MVIMYDDVCSVAPANGGINPKVVIQLNHVREPNNSSILCHPTHTYIYIYIYIDIDVPFQVLFKQRITIQRLLHRWFANQFPKATLATLAPNKSSIIKLEMVSNRVPPGSSRVLCDPARRHFENILSCWTWLAYPFWTESYPVVQEIM